MARLFVTSDNLAVRVEITDMTGMGYYEAKCIGCGRDVLAERESFNLSDAIASAEIHADRCTRCADPDCRTDGRHDAGHRCRKATGAYDTSVIAKGWD